MNQGVLDTMSHRTFRTRTTVPRALAALAVLCLAGFASACVSPRTGATAQCIFNEDCTGELICASRFCREQCVSDRDCTNSFVCRRSEDVNKSVCVPPDFCVYASDCPGAQICSPGGRCTMQCASDYDCRTAGGEGMCLASGLCDFHPCANGDASLARCSEDASARTDAASD